MYHASACARIRSVKLRKERRIVNIHYYIIIVTLFILCINYSHHLSPPLIIINCTDEATECLNYVTRFWLV